VYGVSADPAALVWERTGDAAGATHEAVRGTFWDLGTGRRVGSATVAADFEGFVAVPLDVAFLRVVGRAGGRVALGLRVESLRTARQQQVFANTGPGNGTPPPQLVIESDPAGAPGPALALHVDRRRGSRPRGDGSARRPFATLAAALDLATPGDVVFVAPGRYAETLFLRDDVDVVGSGADRTLIDLGWERPSVRCADALLSGVFVWRDVAPFRPAPFASAVDCTNGASPLIAGSRIAGPGVAILLEGSRATLRDDQIDGAIMGVAASPTLLESEIDWPTAISLSFPSAGAAPFRIERNRIRGMVELDGAAPEGNQIVGNLFLPSLRIGVFFPFSGGLQAAAVGDLGRIASNTFFRTQGIWLCEPRRPDPLPFPLPFPSFDPCADREDGASATIANNIFAFGSVGILVDEASRPTLVHNDAFGNHDPFGISGPSGNYVGLTDPTGVDGNVSEDPRFGGFGDEDAVPGAGSPVLDAGTNAVAASDLDLDGDPRVAGGTVDMGAQERQPGEADFRPVQISVARKRRQNALGLDGLLVRKQTLEIVIRSDAELDAPAELVVESLRLEGVAPRGRCRARDANQDGAADLACRFPFEAIAELSTHVSRRLCLLGERTDGSPIRGCTRAHLLRLSRRALR
jgi:hypothetical protein